MKHYSTNYICNLSLRYLYKGLHLRPSSYPYISGDTFRAMANHRLESSGKLQPSAIQDFDTIFVESGNLKRFFSEIEPDITSKYILISHNGDANITNEYTPALQSKKLVHWFAQNCLLVDPKITPIPIGLENKWFHLHGQPKYFTSLKLEPVEKRTKILYKFNVATNVSERTKALEVLKNHPLAVTYSDWREPLHYLKTLQQHKFVASPPGNGLDCIRTWEAMYLNTVPILKRDSMSQYFHDCGLPIMLVDEWGDLLQMTDRVLDEKYDRIKQHFNCESLEARYWINKILSKLQ